MIKVFVAAVLLALAPASRASSPSPEDLRVAYNAIDVCSTFADTERLVVASLGKPRLVENDGPNLVVSYGQLSDDMLAVELKIVLHKETGAVSKIFARSSKSSWGRQTAGIWATVDAKGTKTEDFAMMAGLCQQTPGCKWDGRVLLVEEKSAMSVSTFSVTVKKCE